MSTPVTALIVDDAVLYRKTVSMAVEAAGGVVAGVAADGAIALRKMTEESIDVVFLDLFMPEQDGIDVLRVIRERWPSVTVVMMSGLAQRDNRMVVEALSLGAVDFIAKPGGKSLAENVETLAREVTRILGIVTARRTNAVASSRSPISPAPAQPNAPLFNPRILLVGASTGGPEALARFLPLFPANFPAPIALVQHMPAGFTRSLATMLARSCRLRVKEAEEGEIPANGVVAVAPGGSHLGFARMEGLIRYRLFDDPPEHHCRPAVDPLFRSAATVYEPGEVAAVVLTGMGTDGAKGAVAIRNRGGVCFAQDEATCVVYGMPRAVVEAGAAVGEWPLAKLPSVIAQRFGVAL